MQELPAPVPLEGLSSSSSPLYHPFLHSPSELEWILLCTWGRNPAIYCAKFNKEKVQMHIMVWSMLVHRKLVTSSIINTEPMRPQQRVAIWLICFRIYRVARPKKVELWVESIPLCISGRNFVVWNSTREKVQMHIMVWALLESNDLVFLEPN